MGPLVWKIPQTKILCVYCTIDFIVTSGSSVFGLKGKNAHTPQKWLTDISPVNAIVFMLIAVSVLLVLNGLFKLVNNYLLLKTFTGWKPLQPQICVLAIRVPAEWISVHSMRIRWTSVVWTNLPADSVPKYQLRLAVMAASCSYLCDVGCNGILRSVS